MGNDSADKNGKLPKSQLVYWLIDRYDTARGAIANRAAIVLSADAIVVATVVLLLDKTLSNVSIFGLDERIVLTAAIGLALVLLAISIYFATMAVANVWKTSRDILGNGGPQREFFYPRETLEKAKGFEAFTQRFNAASEEQLASYALGELWSVTNTAYNRYQVLRKAIRFVIFSLVPLLFALLMFLLKVL